MSAILDRLLKGREVEWVKLGNVCDLQRGRMITAKNVNEGCIPVLSGGKQPAYYHDEYNRQGETIVIAGSGAYAGHITYWNIPIFVGDAFSIKAKDKLVLTKYIYYFLLDNQRKIYKLQKGSGVPHVYPKDLAVFDIPIPPLDVQAEIVRILDTFTALTAKLTAELNSREKQYQYYRDKLLNFSDMSIETDSNRQQQTALSARIANDVKLNYEISWKKLGDIGEVRMCKRILKNQTATSGDIPFYKIGTFGKQADAYISKSLFDEYKQKYSYPKIGEILISASGTIGRTVIFDGKDAYFQDSNIVWVENDEYFILNKFLFYYYQIVNWGASEGGTINRLYNDNIRKIKIPVPPIEEQKRIVEILDKFETLTHSITEGLPKEITLRQKQYEYYREQLLDFTKI